jgi:hypothetical protein
MNLSLDALVQSNIEYGRAVGIANVSLGDGRAPKTDSDCTENPGSDAGNMESSLAVI